MLLAPSSHVLLCLTQFTWHNGISNLVSLITKTKLELSPMQPVNVDHEDFGNWQSGEGVFYGYEMIVLREKVDHNQDAIVPMRLR
jgi:hypothetical protein